MPQPSTAHYQEDFVRYVSKATQLIHSPQTRDNILSMLNNNNPVQRVADATVMVMQRIDEAARASGTEVEDTVKCFAAHDIVNMIVEFGEAARKFTLDSDLVMLALSLASQDYIKHEIEAGRINPQKLKVMMDADMRKLPPKERKEIQLSQDRIAATARKYNYGKGMDTSWRPERRKAAGS